MTVRRPLSAVCYWNIFTADINRTPMPVLLDDNLIWIAFLMGIAGSAHCIGMCGGLAMLASASTGTGASSTSRSKWGRAQLLVLGWLAGKTVTYVILGALLGALSEAIPRSFSGFQTIVVVFTSVLFVVTGLHLAGIGPGFALAAPAPVSKFAAQLSRAVRSSSAWGRFVLGLFNGLLPCGLVYAALAYSLTYQSIAKGALFMAVFGIGTMPALALVGLGTGMLAASRRQTLSKVLGWFLVLLGILTLTRLPAVMHFLHGSGMSM